MKTRIVRIGNSQGVRIPKLLLEEAGLADEVELRVEEGTLVIASATSPRMGWAEAARRLVDVEETGLLDEPVPTRFDTEEWEW